MTVFWFIKITMKMIMFMLMMVILAVITTIIMIDPWPFWLPEVFGVPHVLVPCLWPPAVFGALLAKHMCR